MESFKDDGRGGNITVLFGGKVLVIDVDLAVDQRHPEKRRLDVVGVKTSYAATNDSANNNSNGSPYLDKFLAGSIQRFLSDVQDGDIPIDIVVAAKRAELILDQLRYLVLLDGLAAKKGGGGVKWFVDLDQLFPMLEGLAKEEAVVIATSLAQPNAPLDILLHRGHALPIPYLNCPSLSFLVYLSPAAYLSVLFQNRHSGNLNDPSQIPMDIDIALLRKYLMYHPKGATIATLVLSTHSGPQLFPAAMSLPSLTPKPIFPLALKGSELEHVFLEASTMLQAPADSSSPVQHYTWVLDFTAGGHQRGVIMSQSRMRDIETIVNPLGDMSTLQSIGILAYQPASWVSLLLNPENPLSSDKYIATYQSPGRMHPPLILRLTAPDEPGFIIQKVPVHSMKEVWGILEVVRDQCWLNETLLSCQWSAVMDAKSSDSPKETEATEEELDTILTGAMVPNRIPVNLYMPLHDPATDSIFASALETMSIVQMPSRRPRIVLTSPERPPMSGLVEISVVYDETKPRGICVEVNGAMGAEFNHHELEEVCRRGGTLGLPGRIWIKSQTS
ncbi:hypothetical protein AMATHDRAFT_57707 [Amanita thiersii Skay4041]|uniref:Mediator complex subunit 1 n=1 Tax=Amanita thiersii Skay4041 TaxID=703135 RepID=A0A2A9NM15_9AGAR|nr:hypothetical protein AMATHDRAFT_57707 [Amanita thiersii Skay4041]